jgi:hypothetical protein
MIPTVNDLTSEPLVHRFGDVFSPPALTNFRGTLQSAVDITAIRCLSFPPFSFSDSFPPLSWADSVTGSLFIDGCYFMATGEPISFVWRPDRVFRRAVYGGLALASETILPIGRMAALVKLRVENRTDERRSVSLRFGLKSTVTVSVSGWSEAIAPAEHDNDVEVDDARSALLFRARSSSAVSLQGLLPRADAVDDKGAVLRREIESGEHFDVYYLNVIDDDEADAQRVYDEIARDPEAEFALSESDWNAELTAVFTPGNDRFSGSLPRLETLNGALRSLYHQGVLALLYHKRESSVPERGRTYTTLMPRYWQTISWPWDYQLGSVAHVLLDPAIATKLVEHWMSTEIHQLMGTDWLTGEGVGEEYAVNDFALTKIAYDYVRWSGDRGWLAKAIIVPDGNTKQVAQRLLSYARHWEQLKGESGLADYGGRRNLLECVASYTHEVAGPNVANVFSLRCAAALLDLIGSNDDARQLRSDADGLLIEVRKLYIEGEGCWYARHPGDRLVPVRHAFDLLTVLNTISDELTDNQRTEMVRFFVQELQTATWMHAMSPRDTDAVFDIRPDHQWTGSYVAWPAETATGLLRIGEEQLVAGWLYGIAMTARQGPFGQAHFCEHLVATEAGGARKAPSEFPYLTDWACVGGAAWARTVLEGVFGLDATLTDGLKAEPRLDAFDPHARLVNVAYQGDLYTVDATGVHRQASVE